MVVNFILSSEFFNSEINYFNHHNPIAIDWYLPLPRVDEWVELENIIDDKDNRLSGLSWIVSMVSYDKVNGVLTPILTMEGS